MAGSTILIVDDHEGLRATLRDWLAAALPGAVLSEASTAEEGLAMARRVMPQVVLMDIGLPGINGIEATRRLLAELPQTKVVIVSIHETAVHRAAAAAAGAVAYLPKSSLGGMLRPLLERLIPDDAAAAVLEEGTARHAG